MRAQKTVEADISRICSPQPVVMPLRETGELLVPVHIDQLKFDANGLIPAIIQEQKTGRAVVMTWTNRASLESTIATGKMHFWSGSRQKYWMKSEESGNTQTVKDIAFDCDGDVLLIQVEQNGAACHEGYESWFFRSVENGDFKITAPRLQKPEEIYKKKGWIWQN